MDNLNKNIAELGRCEDIALAAINGKWDKVPQGYTVQLVLGCGPTYADQKAAYLRVGIIYDGVEIADVGLIYEDDYWAVTGSGRSIM